MRPSRRSVRAGLATKASELVREVLAATRDITKLVLHVEPSGVALERREALAATLKANGLSPLARVNLDETAVLLMLLRLFTKK